MPRATNALTVPMVNSVRINAVRIVLKVAHSRTECVSIVLLECMEIGVRSNVKDNAFHATDRRASVRCACLVITVMTASWTAPGTA